jgi:hypothetical protein
MDKAADSIEPWSMRSRTHIQPRLLPLVILIVAAPLGCSTAPPKQAGDSLPKIDTSTTEEPPRDEARPDQEPKPQGLSSGAKGSERKDDAIPDDYSLTERDCDTLGKQYGSVARSDQFAALSPKLTDKQRAQAEANIEKGVGTIEQQWIDSCIKALVGKVADRNALKCAMGAKTVNEFKACIHDESPPGRGGKK